MTCIVGLKYEGVTYIGADSLGANSWSKIQRKDKKVFRLKDTDKALIGFTSSYRMGQLLMYSEGLIDKRDEPSIDHEYLVTKTVPAIIKQLESGGFVKNDDGQKEGGQFLLAYDNSLYCIHSDFQVEEAIDNYSAVGSGAEVALGSLYATEGVIENPFKRIINALKAASKYSIGVEGPYHILNTKNKIVYTE